jgi:transcriptional regulator with XRE-family HTH domain
MPSAAPPASRALAARLEALGARLKAQRKRLGLSATVAAEAAGMSRVTFHRIERGEPSVTMGAWLSAFAAVGLDLELVDPHAARTKPKLPGRLKLDDYPQLKRLAWQLEGTSSLTPREALDLYERNWRHVDAASLDEAERSVIRSLTAAFGGARLLV